MAEPAPLVVRMLVAQLCARVPGGTGRYATSLLRALADHRPEGAALDALTARRCAAVADLPVRVHSVGLPNPVLARLWERGLPPRPARGGIVHAPTLLVPPRSDRYRLVVTVHDVVPWTHPRTLTPRGVAFHQRMGARAAREAALVLTPTAVVADQVRHWLAPQAPVVAVHSGVTVHPVPGDAAARRVRLGVSEGYVLFVGTAEPRKGLDILVHAMARPELAGLSLVVVGPDGWGGVSVAELAARARLGDRVQATGLVTDVDLAALYAGARVLAMPSRAEGFGFPVVEAMTHGIPVVISDDAALVEVAAGAALVVPREDPLELARALGEAAADGAQRAWLTTAGLSRASHFSWESTATRVWALYASIK